MSERLTETRKMKSSLICYCHITEAGTIEVFKSLNPTGERKINLNFGASPVGSVKALV